jgi:serine/threonine protein kinase
VTQPENLLLDKDENIHKTKIIDFGTELIINGKVDEPKNWNAIIHCPKSSEEKVQ